MGYLVRNNLQDGTVYDITQVISSIRWGGDVRQAARKLEVDFVVSQDAKIPKHKVPLGSLLILNNDNVELLRGIAFDNQKDTGGTYTAVAFNHLIYLLKSNGTYIFRGVSADGIIRSLCNDFGIPVGNIQGTGVILNKLILRSMTIYDMCIVALTETTKLNGKKYMLRMREGKLDLIEKTQQPVRWLISEGSNLISASYSESLNDMKNKILIIGDKDQIIAQVQDDNLIKQYGILQELKQESDITASEAQAMAVNLLKDLGKITRLAGLQCLGIDEVEAGTAIEVKESITGLTGTFYVDTDDHTIQNGSHTMSLKLNWSDVVDAKDASEVK